MNKLKLCPFCGGEATITLFIKQIAISCTNCSAVVAEKQHKKLSKHGTGEQTMEKKIYKAKCRYCGGDLEMYTHEDRNIIGDKGFTTVLCCKGCAGNVKIFSQTADQIPDAEHKALECFGIKENDK